MPEASAPPLPSEEEVLGYMQAHSNWGRWGPRDNAGTVNLITPEKRRRAAGLVRSGRAVSIAHRFNTVAGPGNSNPAQHYVVMGPDACGDYIGVFYHGFATTHVDALCHIFWEGRMWNGKPASDVTSFGARSGTVDAWHDSITTRGVLLDIPRLRGEPHVTLDKPVRGYELEAAAEQQGVAIEPGDAVLVYSGRTSYHAANPGTAPGVPPRPGLHVDVIPFLRRNDVALLVWDMLDALPSGYPVFDNMARSPGAVHILALVYLGMPLLDNASLEPLVEACVEEGRWEFLLTVNPLRIRGGTGSPVNPVAVF